MPERVIDTLVIHHSASASGNVETFREMHQARGWSDIGYHEVITNGHGAPDGHIQRGRPHSEIGAGVALNNSGKLQVCLVGNFERGDRGYFGPPTRRQMASLGHWLLVNAKRYGITNYCKIVGHKEIAKRGHATACPGSEMPLKLIRLWFKANVGADEPESLDRYLTRHGVELKP